MKNLKEAFLFFWQLPQNVIGGGMFLFWLVVSKQLSFRVYKGLIIWLYDKFPKWISGISLGIWVGVDKVKYTQNGGSTNYVAISVVKEIIWHEWGHYITSRILGIFYLPLVCLQHVQFWVSYENRFMEKLATKIGEKHKADFELFFKGQMLL
jgi:hypothetical protein